VRVTEAGWLPGVRRPETVRISTCLHNIYLTNDEARALGLALLGITKPHTPSPVPQRYPFRPADRITRDGDTVRVAHPTIADWSLVVRARREHGYL
jgi:hypothetical protein